MSTDHSNISFFTVDDPVGQEYAPPGELINEMKMSLMQNCLSRLNEKNAIVIISKLYEDKNTTDHIGRQR